MESETLVRLVALTAVLSMSAVQMAQAAYSEPASYTNPKKIISLGSDGYSTDGWDDTWVFKKAIKNVAKAGGGKVYVPTGTYRIAEVALKSNVHIEVNSGTVITLHKAASMFSMTDTIENTSIRGVGGRFTIKIPDFEQARVVFMTDVQNALIQNIDIEDPHKSVFSSIEMTWNSSTDGTPVNCTIKNITQDHEEYGYGVVQAQAATSTNYENLKGTGGVPVRLETGWTAMNLKKQGGVFGIRATNITSTEGQAALMMQPHTRTNGDVYGRYLTAVGSEFAVLHEKGGTWKYTADQIRDNNLTTGSFRKLTIANTEAIYKENSTPTRYAHLDYYSQSELEKVFKDTSKESGYSGPSIAVFGDFGNASNRNVWGLKKTGAFVTPTTMTSGYNHPTWWLNRPSI